MIVRDSAGQTYRVTEAGHAELAHCWEGYPVKRTATGWVPKGKSGAIRLQLVRKVGCQVLEGEAR